MSPDPSLHHDSPLCVPNSWPCCLNFAHFHNPEDVPRPDFSSSEMSSGPQSLESITPSDSGYEAGSD